MARTARMDSSSVDLRTVILGFSSINTYLDWRQSQNVFFFFLQNDNDICHFVQSISMIVCSSFVYVILVHFPGSYRSTIGQIKNYF